MSKNLAWQIRPSLQANFEKICVVIHNFKVL